MEIGEGSILSSDDFGCFERIHSRNEGAWIGIGAPEDILEFVE